MSLLDKIFVNLRIISKIQENGKISTTNAGQICIETGGGLTPIKRYFFRDSREKTVTFLRQLMNDVSEITENIISSPFLIVNLDVEDMYHVNEKAKRIDQLVNLSRQLQNSKKGIVNLHTTYKSDAGITSRIEEVMDKIDGLVMKIERSLGLFNNKKSSAPLSTPY